jgi:plasmid stability protein
VPADSAYDAGVQYTLRNIPKEVDRALRERARRERRSLNDVALAALERALGVDAETTPQRDLSDIAGTWISDPVVDEALAHQRTIDPDLWR